MAGPVERSLRQRLRLGEVISRRAATAQHGAVAGAVLDGFVRSGAAQRDGDRYAPIVRVIPEETIQRVNAKLRELPGTPAPTAASIAAAERRRAQREVLRQQLAAATTPEARERVMRESRVLAHAEDALAGMADIQVDADLFGIEMEGA